MNFMQVSKKDDTSDSDTTWSPKQPDDDATHLAVHKDDTALHSLKGNADGRRAHFAKEEHRKTVTIKPDHWFNMDFCNGRHLQVV